MRIVDFEDSGVSDRAFELAVLAEHLSVWPDGRLDTEAFWRVQPGQFAAGQARGLQAPLRPVLAADAAARRPGQHPQPARRTDLQASRLLALLG